MWVSALKKRRDQGDREIPKRKWEELYGAQIRRLLGNGLTTRTLNCTVVLMLMQRNSQVSSLRPKLVPAARGPLFSRNWSGPPCEANEGLDGWGQYVPSVGSAGNLSRWRVSDRVFTRNDSGNRLECIWRYFRYEPAGWCPFYPVLGIGLRFFKTIAFHEALWRMTDHSWGLSTSKLLCSAVRTPSAHRGQLGS